MAEFISETVLIHRDELNCTVCTELSFDTWCISTCMHIVCGNCVQRMGYVPNQPVGPACPYCRGAGVWIKHAIVNRVVRAIHVRCEYKCGSEMEFSAYQMHKQNCVQRPTKCINEGCEWSGIWAELHDHSDKCPYKLVKCKSCTHSMHRGAIEGHIKICPYREVKCEKCDITIVEWKLNIHNCIPIEKVNPAVCICIRNEESKEAPNICVCNASDAHVPIHIIQAGLTIEWKLLHIDLASPWCTDDEKVEIQAIINIMLHDVADTKP